MVLEAQIHLYVNVKHAGNITFHSVYSHTAFAHLFLSLNTE